jgi:tetratricopeptide (TPR) repeat protein
MLVSYFTNLQVVQADITFKMAEPFTSGNQWPIAVFMYNKAIDLSPNEDYYYLFLGRAYLEQAKLVQSEKDKSDLATQAEKDLKKAQRLNPLNTDHTANLARLYNWWAGSTTDATLRAQRAEISSKYYERAVALSRNSATLWGEWALLYLDLLNNPAEAFTRIEKSLSLDAQYPFGLALMGEYYDQIAQAQTDPAKKTENLEKSADYFDRAVAASVGRDNTGKVGYLVALGNVYLELAGKDPNTVDRQRLQQAVDTFLQALNSGPASNDIYRIEEQIGRIYYQNGDLEKARNYLESALTHAPESERARLNQMIQQLAPASP